MTQRVFRISAILLAVLLCIQTSAKPFVHPGIDLGQADLEYLRAKVLEGAEPWKSSFELLKLKTPVDYSFNVHSHVIRGPYNKPDIGASDLMNSSQTAYSAAVLWYITRDEAYAGLAIDILTRWSESLRSFDENDAKLLVALTGCKMCNAAEILRYNYPGWNQTHTDSVTKMLMSAFYPTIRFYFSEANGNWDGAIAHTLLSIAVFTDRRDLFDNAVDHFLHAPANGSLLKYIYPSGQCQETERDQGHVQMGLYEFASAARVAWTQGTDLFSIAGNRLALGLEYTAAFVNGKDVPAYGIPSERKRTDLRSDLDHFLDHYTAQGLDLPNLREHCARATAKYPDANPLSRLTAYRAESARKPAALRPVRPEREDWHCGAKATGTAPEGKTVRIKPGDDLQKMIYEYAATRATLFLSAGEYRLSESLKLPSGAKLCGEGLKTVLVCEPTVKTAAILLSDPDASDITLENFVIEGASTHDTGTDRNSGRYRRQGRYSLQLAGISLRSGGGHSFKGLKLKDLTVINFSRSGIYVSDADGIEITSCDFTGNGSFVVPGPRLQHNLYLHHSKNIRISDSRFDTSLQGCGLVLDHCSSWTVEGCEIARNGWHGIQIAECSDGSVSNCLIEGNDGSGMMAEYLYKGSENISLTGSTVRCNAGYALESYAAENLNVSGNSFTLNGKGPDQEKISQEKNIQLEQLTK